LLKLALDVNVVSHINAVK